MKRYTLWTVLLLVVVLAVVGYLQYREAAHETAGASTAQPLAETAPEPRYPIPAPATVPETDAAADTGGEPSDLEDTAEPLPTLNRSDPPVMSVLAGILGAEPLRELFRLDEFIRRFVVTVDNLPRKKLPQRQLVAKPVAGSFLARPAEADGAAGEDVWMIDPDNAARYTPYVRLATALDTERLVAFYVRYYPLFQEAYTELGYPTAYFNDRLVEVIDHLLQTPTVDGPVRLVRPHVFYQYADPELEALSAGQKTLLRMGGTNAEQIKIALRALRDALTRAPAAE